MPAALALLFIIGLAADASVRAGLAAAEAKFAVLPSPVAPYGTLAEILVSYLLFAPVLEELLYRGWLSGRIAALRFAAYGFAAQALLLASLFVREDMAMPLALAGAALALAGLVHWSLTRTRDTAVPVWFTRNFHWIVWVSSLAFGLIHLGSYEALTHPLGVLVVLPQTIGGLLLAYTRTRLGLGAAMLHHAGYNAVFVVMTFVWR